MSDPSPEPTWQRVTSAALLVILFFTAAVANFSVWLQTTVSNTDDFVAAFAPLPDDVSVAQLLGQSIADAAVDPEQAAANLSEDLPDELQALSVPIATAVNQVAARAATRLVESDPFQAVWEHTLRVAHTALIDLLALRSDVQVLVVDVTEAADQLADRLQALGIDVTVPDTSNITVIQTSQSPMILNVLRFVYTTGWVFPVLFVVLLAAVVLLRRNRREAAVSLALVTTAAMLFDLVLMRILRATVSDQATETLGQQALGSAWDTVTTRLRWQTWIVLLVSLIVAGVARYAGMTPPDSYPSPAMADYLRRWGTATQGAVIVLALLVMLLVPSISFGLAVLIAGIAAVIVFFIAVGKERATKVET